MGKTLILIIVCVLTCFSVLHSCKKEPEEEIPPVIEPPRGVITEPVTVIASYKAIAGGIISSSGGSEKMYRSVCWSTDPDPDTSSLTESKLRHIPWEHFLEDANAKPGSFTMVISELLPNTTYYIRAYAINEAGIAYGNQLYFNTLPDVSDFDGNAYGTANIGSQTWMTENLQTTSFNDGAPIPVVPDATEWRKLTGPGCFLVIYTDPFDGISYTLGTLYNWHAVNTGKLCPVGWHVPTDAEWLLLPLYVGTDILCSREYDDYQGTYADAYFFDAGGFCIRDSTGSLVGYSLDDMLLDPQWWSSTASGNYNAWYFILDPEMMRQKYSKKCGLSVRCIKD